MSSRVINTFKQMIIELWTYILQTDASNTLFEGNVQCEYYSLWWSAQCIDKEHSSDSECVYPGVTRQHLIYIASIIKNGISLIISPSECSINHKGPLNHAADWDDDKLMLRNYAKRHTSWSSFKASSHKLCSCFICLSILRVCTFQFSFCSPKLKTMTFSQRLIVFEPKKER